MKLIKSKFYLIQVIVVLLIFLINSSVSAGEFKKDETDDILKSAESLFKAMKDKDYIQIWEYLSTKSKETIANDTFKQLSKSDSGKFTKEKINNDFAAGGPLSKSYWNAYLNNFDPDMVLEDSKWEMGLALKDKAAIILTYKKSENPAILKLYMENSKWKVGLVETFW